MKFLQIRDAFINCDGKYVYIFENMEKLTVKGKQATPIEIQQLWDILKKKPLNYFDQRIGKNGNSCIFRMKQNEVDDDIGGGDNDGYDSY